MAVYRDVQPGDTLRIGNTIIEVAHKTGQRARLRIESPFDIEHVKAGTKATMTQPDIPAQPPRAAPAKAEAPKQPRLQMPSMPIPA